MKKSKLMLPLALLILASCGGGTSSGTPAGSTTAGSTPASETPASETPASETPASDTTPASETPASETPASESTSEEPAEPGTPAPGDTTSIQYVRTVGEALAKGGTSAASHTVTGTVTAIIGPSYTIQQGDYAVYVFRNNYSDALPENFAVGKKVTVSGYIGNYNGLVQFKDNGANKLSQTIVGDGDTITPLSITKWDVTDIKLSSRLVKIENLVYKSGDTYTAGTSASLYFNLDSDEVKMYVDAKIDDGVETLIQTRLSGFTADETTITYNGVLGCHNYDYSAETKLAALQLSIATADNVTITSGGSTTN